MRVYVVLQLYCNSAEKIFLGPFVRTKGDADLLFCLFICTNILILYYSVLQMATSCHTKMKMTMQYFSVKSACWFFFSFLTLSHHLTHGPMINHYIERESEKKKLSDAAVNEDAMRRGGSLKLVDRNRQTVQTKSSHIIPSSLLLLRFPIHLRSDGQEAHLQVPRDALNVGQISYRALFSTKYSWTEVGWADIRAMKRRKDVSSCVRWEKAVPALFLILPCSINLTSFDPNRG